MPKTIIAEGKTSTEAIEKGLKELNCNYDINQEKCRCCVKRAKTKKSNDMQN